MRLGSLKFWPTNQAQAKTTIEAPIYHVLGDTDIMSLRRSKQELKDLEMLNEISVHHTSAFKSTSPVTQDAQ